MKSKKNIKQIIVYWKFYKTIKLYIFIVILIARRRNYGTNICLQFLWLCTKIERIVNVILDYIIELYLLKYQNMNVIFIDKNI